MTKNRQAKKDARAHKEQSGQSYAASRRQGLVPKQITRKDGVLTTVWVRPEDAGMVGSSARAKVGALTIPSSTQESSSPRVPIPSVTPLTYVQGEGVKNIEPLDDDVSTCTFNGLPALTAKVDGDDAILIIHGVDPTKMTGASIEDAEVYWTALPDEAQENWSYNELVNSSVFTGDMGLYNVLRDVEDGPIGATSGFEYVAPDKIATHRAEYLIDDATDKVSWYKDGELVPEGTEGAERIEEFSKDYHCEDATIRGWRSLDRLLKSEAAQEWIEERLAQRGAEVPAGAVVPHSNGPIKYAQIGEGGQTQYTVEFQRTPERDDEETYMDDALALLGREGGGFKSIEYPDNGQVRLVLSVREDFPTPDSVSKIVNRAQNDYNWDKIKGR